MLSEGLKQDYETARSDRQKASRHEHPGRLSRNSSNKHGRLSMLLTECAEMANHGSGITQRGSHAGGATKPILADILKGIIHRAGAKMGRKREDSEAHTL